MTTPIAAPTLAPLAPVAAPKRRVDVTNLAALVLAALLLAASVAVAVWLINSAPEVPGTPDAQKVSSLAGRTSYGGDAYTGIQNAAADTENSVVAGTNSVTKYAGALQENQLAADAAWWGHLCKGLAALIVAIGAGNFITVLQRSGATRRQRS